MLNNEGQAGTATLLLNPISAANPAAATSAWVAVPNGEGAMTFTVQTGALTGSLVWTLETASDGSGTGGAALTPNEGAFATVTANQVQKRTVDSKNSKGYVRVIGTIVTGPVLVAASFAIRPKIV